MKYYRLLFIVAVFFYGLNLFAYEKCDSLRSCVGRDLKFSVTSGKSAHYLDVNKTSSISKLDTAFTFEMWMKPTQQAGKIQFIGGLWGPAEDKNDVFVAYINERDSLVFELNVYKGKKGKLDNTIAIMDAKPLYGKWNHIAFVYSGANTSANIYINGVLSASATNPFYPVSKLNTPENSELSIQIGSTNALLNDQQRNRTFMGRMDEIRLWNRTLSSTEIICNKDLALAGSEKGLILYYRCNQPANLFYMCDATGFGNWGLMRSGLYCEASDRPYTKYPVLSVKSINDTLYCQTKKTYLISLTDTSICGGSFRAQLKNKYYADNFTIYSNNRVYKSTEQAVINAIPGSPYQFELRLDAKFTGTINAVLEIRNVNSCGWNAANIPVNITRLSELGYSKDRIDYDSLVASCIDKPSIDSVIKICNNSEKAGAARNIIISKIKTGLPAIFQASGFTLPITLLPGECINIPVRFLSRDTGAVYYDSLYIYSDDKCDSVRRIPLFGKVKDALKLFDFGKKRLDSINFGKICVDFASDGVEYYWENNLKDTVIVEKIVVPDQFISKPLKFPIALAPNTGYRSNYFRFMPTKAGVYNDSILFYANAKGCTVIKKVYIKGIGFKADLDFTVKNVDFGSVIVGQDKSIDVEIINKSDESLNVSVYLKGGGAFTLPGAKGASIPPGETRKITVNFKPFTESDYSDVLCFFDQRCMGTKCIPITGKGYLLNLAFNPPILQISDALACASKESDVYIKNISPVNQTLSSFSLSDATGKFLIVEPAPIPANIALNIGDSVKFRVRYSPNDIRAERADKAYIRFKTQDGGDRSVLIVGASITPRISIVPEVLYDKTEIGDTRLDTIEVENVSKLDILIDSLTIGTGFSIISPGAQINKVLKPSEMIKVIVQFAPTQEKDYYDSLKVFSHSPCVNSVISLLQGRGVIAPLQVSINAVSFGFAKNCECIERTIPLINQSLVHPMTIDSVWIDSVGVASAYPSLYKWTSVYYKANSNVLPFSIPAKQWDTIKIQYCPGLPLQRKFIDNASKITIKAHGEGWNRIYSPYLFGKMTLSYEPDSSTILFPPTPVDTFSVVKTATLTIPELDVNPTRDYVKIDSITFMPDERVFFAETSPLSALPYTIDTIDGLTLKFKFKPRAVRDYTAKAKIYISSPCSIIDTTIVLNGSGFAPAFGLNFYLGKVDTIKISSCDTAIIPIYSSRKIPAEVVDINYQLQYDTTKFSLLPIESEYLVGDCKGYKPFFKITDSKISEKIVLLKNFCTPDSIRPVALMKFVPKTPNRGLFKVFVDSVKFDTEEVIFYHIIASSDGTYIRVLQPEIRTVNNLNYDSVQVLDCLRDTLRIANIGDLPVSLESVINIPREFKIISSIPATGALLANGDTAIVEIEFCPRRKSIIDTNLLINSSLPCSINAGPFNIYAKGFAPMLLTKSASTKAFIEGDTLKSTIGDTLSVSYYLDKDFKADIKGKEFWLEKLKFVLDFKYNPRELMYLSGSSSYPVSSIADSTGLLSVNYAGADSLKSGSIFTAKFLTLVPDSLISYVYVDAHSFDSDSLMFLDVVNTPISGRLIIDGSCGLSTLNRAANVLNLAPGYPNPWSESTRIEFEIKEKSQISIKLYSITGKEISSIINNEEYKPGKYEFTLRNNTIPAGTYYLILLSGKEVRKIVMVKE